MAAKKVFAAYATRRVNRTRGMANTGYHFAAAVKVVIPKMD